MNCPSEPLSISLTISVDTAQRLFDFIAEASGVDLESRKADRRLEMSRKAIFGKHGPPENYSFLVSKAEIAKLLQISTRTVDNLTAEGRMPREIRIGRAVRWNRMELAAWVNAGCPHIADWAYPGDANSAATESESFRRRPRMRPATTKSSPKKKTAVKKKSAAKPKSTSEQKWQSPFAHFTSEIGLDYSKLPKFTNGKIMELAEVEMPIFHKWQYKGGELSKEVLGRMKKKLLALFPVEKYGRDSDST